jgi:hypothetical protein
MVVGILRRCHFIFKQKLQNQPKIFEGIFYFGFLGAAKFTEALRSRHKI